MELTIIIIMKMIITIETRKKRNKKKRKQTHKVFGPSKRWCHNLFLRNETKILNQKS